MKRFRLLPAALSGCLLLAASAFGQKHEIGLTLGGLVSHDEKSLANIHLGGGTSLQVNYGFRFFRAPLVAVYGEVHMLANPQRLATSSNTAITRDVASLYLTPGIRVKLLPGRLISPWAEIGGGYGDYEHSTTLLNGAANPVPRNESRAVFEYGAGADFPFWHFVGLRVEARDFVTDPPNFNTVVANKLHNAVLGGGLVLKFGKK